MKSLFDKWITGMRAKGNRMDTMMFIHSLRMLAASLPFPGKILSKMVGISVMVRVMRSRCQKGSQMLMKPR